MKAWMRIAAAGIAMATLVGQADAAVVVGATKIRITNTTPREWLQIAEVLAFQYGTGINVASAVNGGTASALATTWCTENPGYGVCGPNRAIDGVTNGDFYNPSQIYHSFDEPNAFLEIALGAASTLSSLTIFGRTDCCSERDNYNVSIFNAGGQTLYSGKLTTAPAGENLRSASVDFESPVPEPTTWALMLSGFGLLGASMRRRRTAKLGLTKLAA